MSTRQVLPLVAAALVVTAAPASAAPRAHEVSAPVRAVRTLELPLRATHVALHWRGRKSARVRFALSRDGRRFGPMRRVELDEVGEQRPGPEVWGAVTRARGAVAVRVRTSAPLRRLTVLALREPARRHAVATASANVAQPAVISRAGWGADESLRFDANGTETWPPAFYPTQKLIVHHTAGINDDPDPAATIRAIYRYHAVTQGWGDIGYNFLVDESGRVYEGRYSRAYMPGESPTGEDALGNGVTAAHVTGYNSGTVGVALLGTLTSRDASPAARDALERLLAWKAERAGIDPQGASLYTNPVNGTQRTFANIAGHRDLDATECPGGVFYATLPELRSRVAALVSGSAPPPDTTAPAAPAALVATAQSRAVALDWNDNAESDLGAYRVYRRNQDGTWPSSALATVSASAYRNTGLKAGRTYTYRVTAVDTAGNESPPSATASATARR
jgi:hypothetical protein